LRKRDLYVIVALAVVAIVVISIVVSSNGSQSEALQAESASNPLIYSLAMDHWSSIAQKNLTAIMSAYSTGYEAVWWFVNSSGFGPLNGRYDCNIPEGSNNCAFFPESAWKTFFNDTSSLQNYTVCNVSVTDELHGRIVVQSVVYFPLVDRNETLKVPYEIDFQYYNNTWAVWRDWFGQERKEAYPVAGLLHPSCTAGSQVSS